MAWSHGGLTAKLGHVALADSGLTLAGRRHGCLDVIGTGSVQVFSRVLGRQDLDHRLVFDPDLDHMECTSHAVEALPSRARGDCLHRGCIGLDAEREMRRSVATRLCSDETTASCAAWLEFGSRRIDLDARPVLVKLKRK